MINNKFQETQNNFHNNTDRELNISDKFHHNEYRNFQKYFPLQSLCISKSPNLCKQQKNIQISKHPFPKSHNSYPPNLRTPPPKSPPPTHFGGNRAPVETLLRKCTQPQRTRAQIYMQTRVQGRRGAIVGAGPPSRGAMTPGAVPKQVATPRRPTHHRHVDKGSLCVCFGRGGLMVFRCLDVVGLRIVGVEGWSTVGGWSGCWFVFGWVVNDFRLKMFFV